MRGGEPCCCILRPPRMHRPHTRGGEPTALSTRRARSAFYSIQNDSVISSHPIRQYVVDASRFDRTPASTKEEERTALPEEIGVDAIHHRNWAAGSVIATGRVTRVSAPVTIQVSSRPLEPLLQQVPRLGIAAGVCAFQGAVDHIEMGVAVIVGRAT